MKHAKHIALITVLAAALGGCGDRDGDAAVAAKVNGTAIGVAELDDKMQQYRHFPEDKRDPLAGKVLKAMVDTELLRQAALAEKLDQDESVRLKLLQANRLILANAYVEKRRGEVAKPTAAEVKAHFDQHPELYAERKIYQLTELAIQPKPANAAELLDRLGDGRQFDAFTRWLAEQKIAHGSRPQVAAPDDMPEDLPPRLNRLAVGEAIAISGPERISILRVEGLQPQPRSLEQAMPAIEKKLLDQRRAEAMEKALDALRGKARIEYLGAYSETAPASAPH
jgi:EpsD family peptidyl-prolyl cis-trans isomerase